MVLPFVLDHGKLDMRNKIESLELEGAVEELSEGTYHDT